MSLLVRQSLFHYYAGSFESSSSSVISAAFSRSSSAGPEVSSVDTYIQDAKNDNRKHLVEVWNEMKRDKEKHIRIFRKRGKRTEAKSIDGSSRRTTFFDYIKKYIPSSYVAF